MKQENNKNLIFKTFNLVLFTFISIFILSDNVNAANIDFSDCSSIKYTCTYFDLAKDVNATMECGSDNNYTAIYIGGQTLYCTQLGRPLQKNGEYAPATFKYDTSATSDKNMYYARYIAYGYNQTGNDNFCNTTRVATQMLVHLTSRQGISYVKGITESQVKGWIDSGTTSSATINSIASEFIRIRNKAFSFEGSVPSYASSTVTLKYNYTNNRYEAVLSDANNSITKSTISSGIWKIGTLPSGLNFDKNTLTLYTTNSNLPAGSVTFTKDHSNTVSTGNYSSEFQSTVHTSTYNKPVSISVGYKLQLEQLQVKKVSSSGSALTGATFELFIDSSCATSFREPQTVNASGIVTFANLPAGTYYVKETKAPNGYALPSSNCKSASTKTASITFTDTMNKASLSKQDLRNQPLPGAEFMLYNDAACSVPAVNATTGNTFEHKLTDNNGKVTFEGMASINPTTHDDYYYLKEETPPVGYYKIKDSENCKKVKVNGEPVTFTDIKILKKEIAVQKRDQYTNFGINGVKIGLFTDDKCTNKIDERVTSGGQVIFEFTYPETDTISLYTREIESPKSYIPENGKDKYQCYELKIGQNSDQNSVVIYNRPYGTIKLLKLETESKKPLSDIKFSITDAKGKEVVDIHGKKVGTKTTDKNGYVEFKDILYGDYLIKEVKSDGKHKTLKNSIKITLNEYTDSIKLATNAVSNYRLGDVNGDGKVDDSDLLIFQTISKNPNLRFALSPDIRYALDINGDGNVKDSDVKKDMTTLEYYVKFVNVNNESITNAAKNYSTFKDSFCKALDGFECDVSNVDTIYNMYLNNQLVLDQYKTAVQSAEQTAADAYATAQSAYQEQLEAYKTAKDEYKTKKDKYDLACPNGPKTPVDSGSPRGDVIDIPSIGTSSVTNDANSLIPSLLVEPTGDDSTPTYKAECANPPKAPVEPTKPTEVKPANVCPNYSKQLIGDINGDCKIDKDDVKAFKNVSVDINNNGKKNDTDKEILSKYIDYVESSKHDNIFTEMGNFARNRGILCDALAGIASPGGVNSDSGLNTGNISDDFPVISSTNSCSINETYLKDALSLVGKSGNLPENVAKSSLTVYNDLIYILISKQSITKAKELPGAKIIIKDSAGKKVLEYTSKKTPKNITLPVGKYTLTEKIAPKGYKNLSTVVKFEVLDDGSTKLLGAVSNFYKIKKGPDGDRNHLIIYNEIKNEVRVPDTGSNVAIISIISGALLVGLGSFALYRKMV